MTMTTQTKTNTNFKAITAITSFSAGILLAFTGFALSGWTTNTPEPTPLHATISTSGGAFNN